MTKITKASFKSFVKKNSNNLYVRVKSDFDAMVDCVMSCDNGFHKAVNSDHVHDNNLGIQGVWLVGGSRNHFTKYEDEKFSGIDVYNCCGHFIVAIEKSTSVGA